MTLSTRTSLVLHEWERREVTLAPETVEALQLEFRAALRVLALGGGRYQLRARARVGTIVVPNLELHIRPKCGLHNLFWMLAWVYGIAEHYTELIEIEEIEDLREFLLCILTERIELLLRRGLRRGYVEQTDELPVLRGRLDVERHIRRGPAAGLSLPCRFEEYTADLAFNQVIAFTLRSVGTSNHSLLAARLRRLRGALGHLERRRFVSADFDKFEYDRLTQDYRPIHALCRILLDATGGEQNQGALPIGSLLVNMNGLFEQFIGTWLDAHLREPWSVRGQLTRRLDVGGELFVRPDLILYENGRPMLVADTKYKMGTEGIPAREDAYQALAYCRALRVRTCVLLYPDRAGLRRFEISDRENVLASDGLELAQPIEAIEASMVALAARLVGEVAQARR